MKILLIGASGYIGSRLSAELSSYYHLDGCDMIEPYNKELYKKFLHKNYNLLTKDEIKDYDLVLWFAGHSSVAKANNDPWGSIHNNVVNLTSLCNLLSSYNIPIIYASSASVLSSNRESYSLTADETRQNVYDSSKLAFDLLVPYITKNYLGLRLSTVSGYSQVMRWDLVFNAMNMNAYKNKIINVSNSSCFRSILFIEDLIEFIKQSIVKIENNEQLGYIIPLGSWSGSIGQLASEIATFYNVPINFEKDFGTYSFVINDKEISSIVPKEKFYASISERCKIFAQQHNWKI